MNKFFKLRVTSDFLVNSLCAITIGAGFTELTANVFLNKLYVQVCKEATKNKKPVVLSESLRKLHDDVTRDIKLTDFQKIFSTPFVAEGLDPINIGCINYRTGCYIGIPSYYDLNDIISSSNAENLELQDYIYLMKENSESSKKFMDSLNLSESAKKYSIARELILTDNSQIFIKSISWSMISIPMYLLGNTILNLLPANPIKIRFLALFLLCNVGVFICLLLRTGIENFYQIQADKKLCNINEEYIHGGIEYYEKLIQRNLALRDIVPNGDQLYSENGNKHSFISLFSELPLTYRKAYLEKKLKNENNKS